MARLLHWGPQAAPSWWPAAPLPLTATVKNANAWTFPGTRLLTDDSILQEHETPQTTTTIGLQFIDHLKSAKDKT
jgi:hypothetical protein